MFYSEMRIIPNTNPSIGIVNPDGTQKVDVFDAELGNSRSILAPKEKVDIFISNRKNIAKQMGNITFGTAIIGMLIGACTAIKTCCKDCDDKAMGGLLGAIIGCFASIIPATLTQIKINKIDKQFIEENK